MKAEDLYTDMKQKLTVDQCSCVVYRLHAKYVLNVILVKQYVGLIEEHIRDVVKVDKNRGPQ